MLEFVRVIVLLLNIANIILTIVDLVELKSEKAKKGLRFVLGELAFLTSIAYTFLVILAPNAITLFIMSAWFLVGSLRFAQVAWWTKYSVSSCRQFYN